MTARICALSFTPVKGTRLHRAERLELTADGVPGDRALYLVDDRGRMLNAKRLGELNTIVADLRDDQLELRFPDGRIVTGPLRGSASVTTRFYSESRDERLVEGPWSDAVSAYLGRPVRLVLATGRTRGVDRGARGGVSLISRASLAKLAAEAAVETVDARRFRMTIEIDGVDAHSEDAWVDRPVRIGDALVHFHGHVGRCLITSRHPETGVVDLPTLDVLRGYRSEAATTEPLPFGVYGEVVEPGCVRVGDAVVVAG